MTERRGKYAGEEGGAADFFNQHYLDFIGFSAEADAGAIATQAAANVSFKRRGLELLRAGVAEFEALARRGGEEKVEELLQVMDRVLRR